MNNNENSVKRRLIGTMAKIARNVTNETNAMGWPPVCMGILYQPKRPTKIKKTKK